MTARTFDLVLFGATGFTGRLVAQYLDAHAPEGVRIALAGRNPEKLAAVAEGLSAKGKAWPRLQADSSDPASIEKVAQATRVVCSTVGPYAKYGMPLVAACAKAGTHYTDLTGEVQFMRASIDAWNGEAQRTGARIVHSCGFDSIPSEVGVWLLHQKLGALKRATYVVEVLRGGFSGGTYASMFNAMEEMSRDRSLRKVFGDPYGLSPDRAQEADLGRQGDQMGFAYDDFVGRWTAPFVMASVNTRVVRRTNALLNHAYGKQLKYREVSAVPKGPRGLVFAATLAGVGLSVALAQFDPVRALLTSVLRKPGEGPSEEERRTGKLRVRVHGEGEDGRRARVLIEGKGDPGYLLTSLMLSQASLALVLDEARLPKRAGVLTPISALGEVLVERLRAAGMTLAVE